MGLQRHTTTRIRHELRRRMLTVASTELLTPRMRRFGFTSPDLHDFVSASHDDHVKLFFPAVGNDADGRQTCMRDFTPRRFDQSLGMLIIDFALHEAGPATRWATAAQIGDTLEIGGPRGSSVVPDDFDWYLLIGDETALPARRTMRRCCAQRWPTTRCQAAEASSGSPPRRRSRAACETISLRTSGTRGNGPRPQVIGSVGRPTPTKRSRIERVVPAGD